jgi:hypothetical protein
MLAQLAARYKLVAVVSGRSARQLMEWLGPDIEIWGTHGAERAVGGRIELSDAVAPYEGLMRRVLDDARRRMAELALEGTVLEDKTVMVGLAQGHSLGWFAWKAIKIGTLMIGIMLLFGLIAALLMGGVPGPGAPLAAAALVGATLVLSLIWALAVWSADRYIARARVSG